MIIEIDKITQGIEGEHLIRKFLHSENHQTTQIDLLSYVDGKVYLIEAKHQERFNGPPFDGHGLNPKQVQNKLWWSKKINAIPLLMVLESNVDIFGKRSLFYQNLNLLDNLPDSKKFITKTGKRIIYDISEFEHTFI